jgi:hypothetical protein
MSGKGADNQIPLGIGCNQMRTAMLGRELHFSDSIPTPAEEARATVSGLVESSPEINVIL